MKAIRSLQGFLVFLIITQDVRGDRESDRKLRNAVNQFSGKLHRESVRQLPGKNLVISPFSAHVIFSLLSLGARGDTRTQLARALDLESEEFTKKAFKPMLDKVNNMRGITLKTANRIYVKDGEKFELNSDFKDIARNSFDASVINIDFSKSGEAASTINSWISGYTNNKIDEVIDPSVLDNNTRLVLVNAIYFKGDWLKRFNRDQTSKRDFHVSRDDTVRKDMMYQNGMFYHKRLPEWSASMIELPYANEEVSMVVILPDKVDGLRRVEELTTLTDMKQVMRGASKVDVNLWLPKFKVETKIDLKEIMKKLGVEKLFAEDADLGKLLKEDEPLHVSKAIQKAFIEVNEEGTEAAGVSAIGVIRTLSMPVFRQTIDFKVDRPFYYMLKTSDDLILFSGSVRE